MRHFLILFLTSLSVAVLAQPTLDSLANGQNTLRRDTLRLVDILNIVNAYHPVARQAALFQETGDARVLAARGGFDPKLQSDFNQKYFKDDEYYDQLDATIEVPTQIGISAVGGFTRNEGVFLNPRDNVPLSGLWHLGLKVPLGQGLLFDERRATLRKAEIFRTQQEAEQRALLNDLYFDVRLAYWDWAKAYAFLQIFKQGEDLASLRLDATIQRAASGDGAAIDTVEGRTQLFTRQLDRQSQEVELRSKAAKLSTFLWFAENQFLELDTTAIPENIILSDEEVQFLLNNSLEDILNNHPELLLTRYDIEQLEVDRRLKRNKLLPKFDLKYNALAQSGGRSYTINDYTWGASFKLPLFLRKERGDLQETRIKIESTQLKLADKRFDIQANLNGLRDQVVQQIDLINTGERLISDQARLLDAERRLFQVGESSLFLVNARESKLIDSQLKLIKAQADQKVLMALYRYKGAF